MTTEEESAMPQYKSDADDYVYCDMYDEQCKQEEIMSRYDVVGNIIAYEAGKLEVTPNEVEIKVVELRNEVLQLLKGTIPGSKLDLALTTVRWKLEDAAARMRKFNNAGEVVQAIETGIETPLQTTETPKADETKVEVLSEVTNEPSTTIL